MSRYKFIQICNAALIFMDDMSFGEVYVLEEAHIKRRDGLTHIVGTEVRSATVVTP
jgi:hypothetical protein